MMDARKIADRALDKLWAIKRMGWWDVPVGLHLAQMIPEAITNFLSNMFWYPSSLIKGRQILKNQWSFTWPARFHQRKMNMLLPVLWSAIEVALKKLGILHSDARQGILAARSWARKVSLHIMVACLYIKT